MSSIGPEQSEISRPESPLTEYFDDQRPTTAKDCLGDDEDATPASADIVDAASSDSNCEDEAEIDPGHVAGSGNEERDLEASETDSLSGDVANAGECLVLDTGDDEDSLSGDGKSPAAETDIIPTNSDNAAPSSIGNEVAQTPARPITSEVDDGSD